MTMKKASWSEKSFDECECDYQCECEYELGKQKKPPEARIPGGEENAVPGAIGRVSGVAHPAQGRDPPNRPTRSRDRPTTSMLSAGHATDWANQRRRVPGGLQTIDPQAGSKVRGD